MRQRMGLVIAGAVSHIWILACDGTNTTTYAGTGPSSTTSPNDDTARGGTSGMNLDACLACAKPKCPDQSAACDGSKACGNLVSCVLKCSSGDLSCQNSCSASATTDVNATMAAGNYAACAAVQCTSACVPTVASIGGVGGASSLGSGGSGTAVVSTDNANGGSSTGSGGTSSGVGGATAEFEPVSGINWLSFEEDWADPSVAPNGAFNVSGVVYAYGDDCATLEWDPVNRCASGTLCSPGSDYQNWGVAIGFDFHNTGDSGRPANAKLTWNPATVDARGVAWDLYGTAPGLQLWVLQMDPQWSGTCTADSCEINGPPFGYGSINTIDTGNIYFTNTAGWLRDDWGGTGTNYALKTADTVSLQFKLSATVAGGETFHLCIDRLGIIY